MVAGIVLILAILYLAGLPVGTPLAICAIVFAVLDIIIYVLEKIKEEKGVNK